MKATDLDAGSASGLAARSGRVNREGDAMNRSMIGAGTGVLLALAGIVRADVRVFFTNMTVNDCNEIGVCDWKLSCSLGNQQETEFFSMVEANTNETVPINRVLTQREFPPVTVNCTVMEHDGGIGAEWEAVGGSSVVVRTTGPHSIRINQHRDEGDVTVAFTAESIGATGQPVVAQVLRTDGAISGVLLAGRFRTQQELGTMFPDDRRNTLITELVGRTRDTIGYYQSLNDADLAGAGALLAYLRHTGTRTDPQIRTMSADDMRNTVIVEVASQTGRGSDLQALNNMELIQLVLGRDSYIRGVLLMGRFRTQRELTGMSPEDQRNTLITELGGRTADTVAFYQSLNDADLAGAGALLVYLRHTGSRTDPQIRTMTADAMRNTVIVEVAAHTWRGIHLQALSNIKVVGLTLERALDLLH
jgi:hypothetical protein